MNNLKAIVGILTVFLLGVASGAFVTHIHECRRTAVSAGDEAARREQNVVAHLEKKLGLDGRQREQVRAIVHEVHSSVRQVRRQCRPQIDALLDQGQTRISTILTPDQQEIFRDLVAERKRHRQQRHP
jgi:Spy/CpxP family protein refolding chaperone